MMGRTHATSGAALWLAGTAAVTHLGVHLNLFHTAIGTAVCAAAALWPDLDHPSSKVARSLGLPTRLLAKLVGRLCAALHKATKTPKDRADLDGHRTLTHTIVWALASGLVVTAALLALGIHWPAVVDWAWLGAPVAAGCIAHLIGDCLTNTGCPVFWPVVIAGKRWYPFGPRLMGTNGPGERHLMMPLFVAMTVGGAYLTLT